MAYTLSVAHRFPDGTSVGAYAVISELGKPLGTATDSDTVASGSVTLTLPDGFYYIVGQVGSEWRYLTFYAETAAGGGDSSVAEHNAATTSVHGIADTSALETTSGAQTKVDTHSADTTSVHGITDTSDLTTDSGSLATHAADTTSVHGLSDTSKAGSVVAHGATASTARPTGFEAVIWIGSVAPGNIATGDLWLEVP